MNQRFAKWMGLAAAGAAAITFGFASQASASDAPQVDASTSGSTSTSKQGVEGSYAVVAIVSVGGKQVGTSGHSDAVVSPSKTVRTVRKMVASPKPAPGKTFHLPKPKDPQSPEYVGAGCSIEAYKSGLAHICWVSTDKPVDATDPGSQHYLPSDGSAIAPAGTGNGAAVKGSRILRTKRPRPVAIAGTQGGTFRKVGERSGRGFRAGLLAAIAISMLGTAGAGAWWVLRRR
jgi:hypothetical protein